MVSASEHGIRATNHTVKAKLPLEVATGGVLCKKVFLEISQNSQENTCARVSF